MPDVDVVSDLAAVFAKARSEEDAARGAGQCQVAIINPGRMIMFMPGPSLGSVPEDSALASRRALLGSDAPLDITVISYTKLEALMEDKERTKCIPFLGHLISFAYCGHRVVVFEGHPSAFEAGVRGTDILLVDSGMVPFLQSDWVNAAFRHMKPGGRLLVHDRAAYTLGEIKPKTGLQSRDTDPAGHGAYVNGFLTTLARTKRAASIIDGAPLPTLAGLTDDPRELAWIAGLPFKYGSLEPRRIISLILGSARKEGLLKRRLVLKAKLFNQAGGPTEVAFKVTSSLSGEGKQTLHIEPL